MIHNKEATSSPHMNRLVNDVDLSGRFQELGGPWSQPQHPQQTPPVPPRNYFSTRSNANLYNSYNTIQPYHQRPYMGMGSYMGMGMNNHMYGNSYMNHDNFLMSGRYMQMAQDLFSPVFQNSNNMITTLRDVTYTADSALVSMRMLFDAFNMVATNLFRVRDFLQKYAVSFATLGSSHWIFHLIYKLLRLFGILKKNQSNLDNVWSRVQGDEKKSMPVIANIMALSAVVTTFSYVLPKLIELIEKHILKKDNLKKDPIVTDEDWNPFKDNFTPVQAKYNFSGSNSSEINLTQGQKLRMKTLDIQNSNQLPLWVLVADNNFNKGFVPLSYLTPVDKE